MNTRFASIGLIFIFGCSDDVVQLTDEADSGAQSNRDSSVVGIDALIIPTDTGVNPTDAGAVDGSETVDAGGMTCGVLCGRGVSRRLLL